MRLVIVLFLATACCGCFSEKIEISGYECSSEQLDIVEREMGICAIGYLASHCYTTLRASYCSRHSLGKGE